MIIRVINADAKQAPMLRLRAANKRMEAGCADDGQFPDGTPNDGQYHCTSIIRTQDLQSQTWTLEVLVPTPDGEEDSLGVFSYEGKTGLYFATVKMGDASAARPDPFAVVGPLGSRADDGAASSGEDQENKPPLDELHGGPGSQGGHSSIHLWLVALGALGLGWLLGTRTRHRRWSIDAATPIPVSAIDERGPIPEPGVAFISSAQPSHTLLHVARQLMERRRIVVVGGPERMDLDPIHSVFWVTDPDQHAIETAVQQLLVDNPQLVPHAHGEETVQPGVNGLLLRYRVAVPIDDFVSKPLTASAHHITDASGADASTRRFDWDKLRHVTSED